jgi:thiol-disulfide isomerase/thioredoxin
MRQLEFGVGFALAAWFMPATLASTTATVAPKPEMPHAVAAAKPATAPKAWLGIAFQDIAAEAVPAAFKPVSPDGIVRVLQVYPGTSADQAGLKVDDYVLAVNGAPLQGRRTLLDSIRAHGVGDVVTLKLGRSDKVITQKMALSPKPEDMASLTKSLYGSKAPELEGAYYNGNAGSLAQNKGKVVLLDFWATWCGPCRITLPSLEALHQEYKDKGLVIVGVSSEPRADLDAFQQQKRLSYPLFHDVAQLTMRKYQAFSYPTLVLVDKQGLVQRVEVGAHPKAEIERWVKELL